MRLRWPVRKGALEGVEVSRKFKSGDGGVFPLAAGNVFLKLVVFF